MQITCSNCNARYTLTRHQMKNIGNAIFSCTNCKKSIKITICPHCNTLYSITFSAGGAEKYRFRCKKCDRSFVVEFPAVHETRQKRYSTHEMPEKKIDKGSERRERKREIPQQRSGIVFRGPLLREFTVKELLTICLSAFTPEKLIVSASGLIVLILLLFGYSSLEGALFETALFREALILKTVLTLIPLALLFIGIIIILAIVSRITLEKIFFQTQWTLQKTRIFIAKIGIPVLVSNILILLSGSIVLILFGKIPLVGPLFYALLFLPIYLISLVILLTVLIGFWFYPPILAYREVGIIKNIIHLYHFVKRHNLTLIIVIPILITGSAILFTVIYFLHVGAFSLTLFLSKALLGEGVDRLFSAIPFYLSRISDLSLIGTDISIYKSFMTDLLLTHQIGGVLIGVFLSVLSILLFASYLSIIGTISSHIYIVMERNIDISDRKKIKLLLVLLLLLLALYLLRRVILI